MKLQRYAMFKNQESKQTTTSRQNCLWSRKKNIRKDKVN